MVLNQAIDILIGTVLRPAPSFSFLFCFFFFILSKNKVAFHSRVLFFFLFTPVTDALLRE